MDRSKSVAKGILDRKSCRAIAKEQGVTPSTIAYWAEKLGLKFALSEDENGIRPYMHDLVGKKFGILTVVGRRQRGKRGQWFCLCKCDCGSVEKLVSTNFLISGRTITCGCRTGCYDKIRGSNSSQFTGYKEIHGAWWTKIKVGAAKRNISFDISIQDAWELFLSQQRTCALSGLEICFSKTSYDRSGNTASLDRIDSKLGYFIGNVQWVHRKINFMKHTLDQDDFIMLCNRVSDFCSNKKG